MAQTAVSDALWLFLTILISSSSCIFSNAGPQQNENVCRTKLDRPKTETTWFAMEWELMHSARRETPLRWWWPLNLRSKRKRFACSDFDRILFSPNRLLGFRRLVCSRANNNASRGINWLQWRALAIREIGWLKWKPHSRINVKIYIKRSFNVRFFIYCVWMKAL